jgi:hypothetical protein
MRGGPHALSAALFAGTFLAGGLGAQERFTLADVQVLSGCWAGPSTDVELREQWTEASGGVMLGNTRFLRDGQVIDWEFGRIVEDSTGVTLWPYPRGVVSEHGFPLVGAGSELVFENPLHDFPVRIIYTVDGPNRLHPRIEGADGRGTGWSLSRLACPDR